MWKLSPVLIVAGLVLAPPVSAKPAPETPLSAAALAALVAERPANEGRVGAMHFRLESSNKRVREREALMIHSEAGDTERIAIFFTAPAMIEETAFLSFNHAEAEDENWLYLPATERVRRLPVSERGDYFLGTDLTYGDIKDNFKFALDDWTFSLEGEETVGGVTLPVLSGIARTPEIGLEMGYASFRAGIDTASAFPVWVEYADTDGEPLKRVEVLKIGEVGGAATALHFTAENLQSGHRTEVRFSNMRHAPGLDDAVFDPHSLAYGAPDVD